MQMNVLVSLAATLTGSYNALISQPMLMVTSTLEFAVLPAFECDIVEHLLITNIIAASVPC